jgi:hypothetical protein
MAALQVMGRRIHQQTILEVEIGLQGCGLGLVIRHKLARDSDRYATVV